MKVTKKQIKEQIQGIITLQDQLDWRILEAGIYLKDGELNLYTMYHGEGVDEDVFNKRYDAIYQYTDVIREYLDKQMNLRETVDSIYEYVQDFIVYNTNETVLRNNIAEILKEKKVSINKLSQEVNMTYKGMHDLVNRSDLSTTQLGVLVDIASYLNVENLYEKY